MQCLVTHANITAVPLVSSSLVRWAATASYDAGTVGVVELLPAPEAAAVEVSHTLSAAAGLLPEQQQGAGPGTAAAAAEAAESAAGVFLPAELQLGSVTTYPTEVVGAAAHEAKFSPDGSLLVSACALNINRLFSCRQMHGLALSCNCQNAGRLHVLKSLCACHARTLCVTTTVVLWGCLHAYVCYGNG
jgi:hypothetical protein